MATPLENGGNECVAQPPFTANACTGLEVRVDGIAVPVQYFGPGDGTNNQINFVNSTSSTTATYQVFKDGVASNTFTHEVASRPSWLRIYITAGRSTAIAMYERVRQ
jgi:hypothetical protein